MTVLAAFAWPTNGHLIEDVAKLGYLDGRVLDVTYGNGVFWQRWKPAELVACDINAEKSPLGRSVDFRNLEDFEIGSFDAVVLDPPYKLNGTPSAPDERYGADVRATREERLQLVRDGIRECLLITRRFLLVKCMDQVEAGQKRWQTYDFTAVALATGARLVDRFDMLTVPRPQPPGRRQLHAQGNYSSLLIFEKGRA